MKDFRSLMKEKKFMKKVRLTWIMILACFAFISCKDNSVTSSQETLVYQYDGVLENLGGDCSAVQVRTRSLGNFDFTNAERVKFTFTGMSDADLSSIQIYYLQNDQLVNLVNLENRDEINSTSEVEAGAPEFNGELFSRVTLKSSVCTGQIFYITFSDLKIYTIQ